jgi:hypothetical protein
MPGKEIQPEELAEKILNDPDAAADTSDLLSNTEVYDEEDEDAEEVTEGELNFEQESQHTGFRDFDADDHPFAQDGNEDW